MEGLHGGSRAYWVPTGLEESILRNTCTKWEKKGGPQWTGTTSITYMRSQLDLPRVDLLARVFACMGNAAWKLYSGCGATGDGVAGMFGEGVIVLLFLLRSYIVCTPYISDFTK